jgi:predicted aspartyl protease
MAIDFPASPTNGQTFTSGALVYTYDGTKWTAQPAGVTGGTKIEVGNTKAEIVDTGSDGRFVVTTEGSERLRVNSAGEIGLAGANYGTSGQVLTSGGTGAAPTWSTPAAADKISEGNTSAEVIDTGSDGRFVVTTEGTERARIDSSGRLGIGTASPGGLLEIKSSSADPGFFRLYNAINTATSWGIDFYRDADGGTNVLRADIKAVREGGDATALRFATTVTGGSSPTERMRLNNTGTLSVYGPADNPSVNFSVSHGPGSHQSLAIYSGGSSTTSLGTKQFFVQNNGDVRNTNNSYGSISDLKLKENIVDANSQWDDLKALQVRNYNFKEGQTHTQIGLIAQEVELVSPGLVSESPDRDEEGNDLGTVTKSVNYSVLYMKAVKALQEAMERIEALEAKVAALEAS